MLIHSNAVHVEFFLFSWSFATRVCIKRWASFCSHLVTYYCAFACNIWNKCREYFQGLFNVSYEGDRSPYVGTALMPASASLATSSSTLATFLMKMRKGGLLNR